MRQVWHAWGRNFLAHNSVFTGPKSVLPAHTCGYEDGHRRLDAGCRRLVCGNVRNRRNSAKVNRNSAAGVRDGVSGLGGRISGLMGGATYSAGRNSSAMESGRGKWAGCRADSRLPHRRQAEVCCPAITHDNEGPAGRPIAFLSFPSRISELPKEALSHFPLAHPPYYAEREARSPASPDHEITLRSLSTKLRLPVAIL